MKAVLFLALAAFIATPAHAGKTNRKPASAKHECHDKARELAGKLVTFHNGGEPDDRMVVEEEVTQLPPVKSPDGKHKYPVLEVGVGIYKGSYRTRFIFGHIPGCVLVGQEVLEETNL